MYTTAYLSSSVHSTAKIFIPLRFLPIGEDIVIPCVCKLKVYFYPQSVSLAGIEIIGLRLQLSTTSICLIAISLPVKR